jgi:hypothetical protein
MHVFRERCVYSGRGLCVGLITRPDESYLVWCVCVWLASRPDCSTPGRSPQNHLDMCCLGFTAGLKTVAKRNIVPSQTIETRFSSYLFAVLTELPISGNSCVQYLFFLVQISVGRGHSSDFFLQSVKRHGGCSYLWGWKDSNAVYLRILKLW